MEKYDNGYFETRYNALYAAYRKACRRSDVRSHKEAIVAAVNSPSPSFGITPGEAYRQVLRLLKGRPPSYKEGSVRRKIAFDLFDEYNRLRATPTFRDVTIEYLASFVALSGAPKFYMSYSRARKIIDAMKKKRRNERKL